MVLCKPKLLPLKSLTLEKLEAMTAVCSVGLDMIAVPGDTSAAVISGIIADEIGADYYTSDAASAAEVARSLFN